MSLTQHVAQPTYELGHTLDLVITRKSDNLISDRHAPDILFSDHQALLFKLQTARPPVKVDKNAFADEICNSELFQMNNDNPDKPTILFDNTLRSLLDRHAPVKQRNITIRPCVPWMNDETILAKLNYERGKLKGNGELHKLLYKLRN